jgi:beta-amylase
VSAVQWGATEKAPSKYDFSAYRQVCEMLRRYDLKLQVVMSFHSCGTNVNDDVHVPLPKWVQEVRGGPLRYGQPHWQHSSVHSCR